MNIFKTNYRGQSYVLTAHGRLQLAEQEREWQQLDYPEPMIDSNAKRSFNESSVKNSTH